jgi:hypothetical protein
MTADISDDVSQDRLYTAFCGGVTTLLDKRTSTSSTRHQVVDLAAQLFSEKNRVKCRHADEHDLPHAPKKAAALVLDALQTFRAHAVAPVHLVSSGSDWAPLLRCAAHAAM